MPEPNIKDLFTQAIALDTEGRERFIAELKVSNPDTAELLNRLIEHDDEPLTDLDRPLDLQSELPSEQSIPSEHKGLPRQFGKYRLLRRVGAGGVGIVFEAEQDVPHRRVAIKVMHPWNSDQTASDRFRHEVHALGRLDHPDIARLYECSVADLGFGPQQYLSMEFVEGVSIVKHAVEQGLSIERRIRLLKRVAQSVHSMHLKGVVHRDLKPSNVLVTNDGAPKLVDFGVASLQGAGIAPLTGTGQILGTPRYMSPEQISGNSQDVDSRTDVYSLGLLAYEMLTGALPSLDPARLTPPPLLGSIDRRLRDDIEHVVAKALEPKPEDRYQSASAFAEDLGRSLTGQSLAAKYGSFGARAVRVWKHKKKRIATSTLALVTLLTAAIAVPTSIYQNKLAVAKAEHANRMSYSFAQVTGILNYLQDDTPLAVLHNSSNYNRLLADLEPYPTSWALAASAFGLMIGMKGEAETGIAMLDESIEVATNTEDPVGFALLLCIYRKVHLHSFLKDHESVLPLSIDGYRIACDRHGSDSRMATQFALQIADLYLHTHQTEQANTYASLALNNMLSQKEPNLQDAINFRTLGPLLMRLDRFEEAEPILRQSIAEHRSIGYTKSEFFSWQVSALASIEFKRGNIKKAEHLFRLAARHAVRVTGEHSHRFVGAIQGLGVCLREQGRLEEAEFYLKKSLTLRRQMYTAPHEFIANSLVTLANLYQLMPDTTPERVEIARQGLAMRRQLETRPDEIAEAELALGALLLKHGDITEAAELLVNAEFLYSPSTNDRWRHHYAHALVLIDQILDRADTPETGNELLATYDDLLALRGEDDPWVKEINRWRTQLGAGSLTADVATD